MEWEPCAAEELINVLRQTSRLEVADEAHPLAEAYPCCIGDAIKACDLTSDNVAEAVGVSKSTVAHSRQNAGLLTAENAAKIISYLAALEGDTISAFCRWNIGMVDTTKLFEEINAEGPDAWEAEKDLARELAYQVAGGAVSTKMAESLFRAMAGCVLAESKDMATRATAKAYLGLVDSGDYKTALATRERLTSEEGTYCRFLGESVESRAKARKMQNEIDLLSDRLNHLKGIDKDNKTKANKIKQLEDQLKAQGEADKAAIERLQKELKKFQH